MRRVFTVAAWASAVLALGMAVLLARSFWTCDALGVKYRALTGPFTYKSSLFISNQGTIHAVLGQPTQLFDEPEPGALGYWRHAVWPEDPWLEPNHTTWIVPSVSIATNANIDDGSRARVSTLELALLFGLWPIWRVYRYLRARRRILRALCVNCGYDIRASDTRCPECGSPIAIGKDAGQIPHQDGGSGVVI
jgi:hypothetical protein